MSSIGLLGIVSTTISFYSRYYGRRNGANAGVQQDRITTPRARVTIVASCRHAIQITWSGLYSRIGRFIRGRRATFGRLLVGRRATLNLDDRGRRRARRIEDRSQPQYVNGNRGKTIGGQLCLVVFLHERGCVIAPLFRTSARAARAIKGSSRVLMKCVLSNGFASHRNDRSSRATSLGRV